MPRPRFEPTEAQRLTVKSLVACGIRQEEIASNIGIRSPKTLREHFGKELVSGVTEANYKVAKTVYEKAIKGDMYAAQFWLRCRGGPRIVLFAGKDDLPASLFGQPGRLTFFF